MKVYLTREMKLRLLEGLKLGYIESEYLKSLCDPSQMTEGEINAELERLYKSVYPSTCERLQRCGCCKMTNARFTPEKDPPQWSDPPTHPRAPEKEPPPDEVTPF